MLNLYIFLKILRGRVQLKKTNQIWTNIFELLNFFSPCLSLFLFHKNISKITYLKNPR